MSEEEKEAIEELNEILKQWRQIINIENEEEREIEMSLYFEDMPFVDIQTALNLIDKLQKENEEYHRIKKDLIRVNKKIYDVDTIDEFIKTIDKLQKENQELKEKIREFEIGRLGE